MKFTDLAMEENGNLLVLVTTTGPVSSVTLTRCNPSGEPLEPVAITNLPAALTSGFTPMSLSCRKGLICLTDRETGKTAVLDAHGEFVEGIQILGDSTATSGVDSTGGTTSSAAPDGHSFFWKGLLSSLFTVVALITKPSSSRNRNDPVNSCFYRNGLLISVIGNKLARQD